MILRTIIWVFILYLSVQCRLPWVAHDLGPNSRGRACRQTGEGSLGENPLKDWPSLYPPPGPFCSSVSFICEMGIIMVNTWRSWGLSRQIVHDSLDPMAYSPPGSSVHGVLQARILEWVAVSCPRGSFQLRNRTGSPASSGRFFTDWALREVQIPGSLVNMCTVPSTQSTLFLWLTIRSWKSPSSVYFVKPPGWCHHDFSLMVTSMANLQLSSFNWLDLVTGCFLSYSPETGVWESSIFLLTLWFWVELGNLLNSLCYPISIIG